MKTCKKCGSTEFDKDGPCTPCRRVRRTAWRKANAVRIGNYKSQYDKAHSEHIKAYFADYCVKNPGKIKELNAKWARENPEKLAAADAAWRKANPELLRSYSHTWRALKLAAGGSFTKSDIIEIRKRQKSKCVVCRADISKTYHIDHIMPLSLGGHNGKGNIQLLCPHCNHIKSAKHPIDFMQSVGFLL